MNENVKRIQEKKTIRKAIEQRNRPHPKKRQMYAAREFGTVEQALEQFDDMIWYFIHKVETKTNAVCDVEDLYQEGRIAIMLAHASYDVKHEASFTTWVHLKIKYAILNYQKENLSALSGGAYLYQAMRNLEKNGDDITVENLVKKQKLSRSTASAINHYKLSFNPVGYGVNCVIPYQDIDTGAMEKIEWENRVDPNDCFESVYGFHLDNYKDILTKIEYFILSNYFGFENEMTMNEIGQQLNMSRKAVAYTMNKALKKLRDIDGIADYAVL